MPEDEKWKDLSSSSNLSRGHPRPAESQSTLRQGSKPSRDQQNLLADPQLTSEVWMRKPSCKSGDGLRGLRFLSERNVYCCMSVGFCGGLLHNFIWVLDSGCQKVICHVLSVSFPKRSVDISKQGG